MIPPEVKSASEVSPGGRTLVRDHRVEEGAEMPAHHVGGGAEGEVLVVGTRDHDHVGMRERGDDAVRVAGWGAVVGLSEVRLATTAGARPPASTG